MPHQANHEPDGVPENKVAENDTRCPICSGTGWRLVPVEHNGRTVEQAARCECIRVDPIRQMLESSRIPSRYQHCELSNFDHTHDYSSLASAYYACQRYVEEYPNYEGLLIWGPIGCGKTHLAVGVIKDLVRHKSVDCIFYDHRSLLKEVQHSYNDSVQITEMEVLRPVLETELLVLDELGSSKPTDWVTDLISHILNTRYNEKLPTIITTNYPDALAGEGGRSSRKSDAAHEETLGDRIGDRMLSRLHEMCRVVQIQGQDYRMGAKNVTNHYNLTRSPSAPASPDRAGGSSGDPARGGGIPKGGRK
jgi:DNA replication protein DnaC